MMEYLLDNVIFIITIYNILAEVQLCIMYAAWKPQYAAKIVNYSFLILEFRSEIGFESNICLAEKVTASKSKLYYLIFYKIKWVNNLK